MKKVLIAAAMVAMSASANAVVLELSLTTHQIGRDNNAPSNSWVQPVTGAPTYPAPTYYFDTDTQQLTSSGVTHVRSTTVPMNANPAVRVFDRYITNLAIDTVNGVASATAYNCVNGGFQNAVGASFCGNYTWGDNFTDDSTMVYSGTTATRTMGGDDVISGDPQTLADYDIFFSALSGQTVGSTLELLSSDWLPQPQSPANSAGLRMVFTVTAVQQVVPVPAAVWLFGSALGLMGVARRRLAA